MTFFFANIPYFNYQINFQSSHLTKKETEDASKRLSSYCMGALNYDQGTLYMCRSLNLIIEVHIISN